mgnify:CR=1 FL=1
MVQQKYDISVCMITYNHEKFIRKAIESIFDQEFYGLLEFIICDDNSSDRTNNEILKLKNNSPYNVTVKHFRHKKNIGVMENLKFAINQCSGKYIAYCEGDDFWTDKDKLKIQFDFLNKNLKYSVVFGNSNIVDDLGKEISPYKLDKKFQRDYSYEEMVKAPFINTLTMLFRNEINKKILGSVDKRIINGDVILFSLLAPFGGAKYLDFSFGSYRKHSGGVWSEKNKEYRLYNSMNARLEVFRIVDKQFKSIAEKAYWYSILDYINHSNFFIVKYFVYRFFFFYLNKFRYG